MTDQEQHQMLEITGQDLALLLKQTILTFCQMNVAYRNKLEVVGSIHIKADEVEISSFLLQENCLNSSTPAQQKSDGESETLTKDKKDAANSETGEKVEESFCIVDANGDEQDGKSDKDNKSEAGELRKDGDDDGDDSEKMETETSLKGDDAGKKDEAEGNEETENEEAEKKDGDSAESENGEKLEKQNSDKESDQVKKAESSNSSAPLTPQASIAKQLTGASLAAGSSGISSIGGSPGPRPVTLMVNGTHPVMRGGIPMMRPSNVVTSTASPLTNSVGMGARIPIAHAAMVAMGAAQMAGLHPHHMFLPHHGHHGHVPQAAHMSARAAVETIYRQNPPLTNRTVNLAGGGVMRHPSMAAARAGAMVHHHPQMAAAAAAGMHMMSARPAGRLVCPLCMASFTSQDTYLRHLSSHQRSAMF